MTVRTVVTCTCDRCKGEIPDRGGVAVLGNINAVSRYEEQPGILACVGGGFVGNNLEEVDRGVFQVARASHYCLECFSNLVRDIVKDLNR